MSLINNIVFAVLNILNNFTENDFMQKTLLTSNCWNRKNFKKLVWTFILNSLLNTVDEFV